MLTGRFFRESEREREIERIDTSPVFNIHLHLCSREIEKIDIDRKRKAIVRDREDRDRYMDRKRKAKVRDRDRYKEKGYSERKRR